MTLVFGRAGFQSQGKGFPDETVRYFIRVLWLRDGISRLQPEHGHCSRPGTRPGAVSTEPLPDGIRQCRNADCRASTGRSVLGRAGSRSESVQLSRLPNVPTRQRLPGLSADAWVQRLASDASPHLGVPRSQRSDLSGPESATSNRAVPLLHDQRAKRLFHEVSQHCS